MEQAAQGRGLPKLPSAARTMVVEICKSCYAHRDLLARDVLHEAGRVVRITPRVNPETFCL